MRKLLHAIHGKLGDLWWYTLLGFGVNRAGEVVNLVIGIYLVPRLVPAEELGAVTPLMSVAGFVGLPIALLLIPVAKFLNVFAAREEYGKVKALLLDSLLVSLALAFFVLAWLSATGDAILERMHLADRRILLPVAGFAFLSCVEPITTAAQRSLKCFRGMLAAGFLSPYVRLAAMLALLAPLGALGYLTAQFAMSLFNFGFGLAVLCLFLRRIRCRRESYWPNLREMALYSLPLVAWTLAGRIQGPVEAFVIRHRLPTDVSAGFYFATVFGAIPGYAVGALSTFFWPIVSERFEKGRSTRGLLLQSMLFTMGVGALAIAAVAAVIPHVFALPGPWHAYGAFSKYVWQVGLLAILKGVQGIYTSHESACRHFAYIWYMVPLMLAEAAVLYALPAWHAAAPYLPASIWSFVDAHWTTTLQSLLSVTIVFNALFAAAMIADWLLQGARKKEAPHE